MRPRGAHRSIDQAPLEVCVGRRKEVSKASTIRSRASTCEMSNSTVRLLSHVLPTHRLKIS